MRKNGQKLLGVKELADRYCKDPVANELFKNFERNLGEFLAPWIKTFNSDCLVPGGNISKSFLFFKNRNGDSNSKTAM